jgi:hypothetical protein
LLHIRTRLTEDAEQRDRSGHGIAFELLGNTDPVDPPVVQTGDDQVRLFTTGQGKRLFFVRGIGDAEVLCPKSRLDQAEQLDLVGDEDQTVAQAVVSRAEWAGVTRSELSRSSSGVMVVGVCSTT